MIPFLSFFFRRGPKGAAPGFRPVTGRAYAAVEPDPLRPPLRTGLPDEAAAKLPEWTHKQLVEHCRYAADNFGVAKEIITSMQIYAIGSGLRAQARTRNEAWNAAARERWRIFERRADYSGKFSLRALCFFAVRALYTDGEIFFVKRHDAAGAPRLQILETHRLSYKTDPAANCFDGIEFDADGAPLAYWFTADASGTPERVPAEYVLAFRACARPSETRSAPMLQHAVPNLTDAATLLRLEKRSAAAQANFALALTTPSPETAEREINAFGAANGEFDPSRPFPSAGTGGNAAEGPISEISKLDGGKMIKLPEGTRLDVLESKRPSQAFAGLYASLLRQATLGVSSYDVAVDASAIGGATVRLQVAKMERRVSALQDELIEQFLEPCWRFVIGSEIAAGTLPAEENWTDVEFSTPRRLTVDAGRESAALLAEVKAGIRPIEDVFDAMGFGDCEAETLRRAQLMKRAAEIAAEHGVAPEKLIPALFD